MTILKGFEVNALSRLRGRELSEKQIKEISSEGELVSLDFTGVGYLLNVKHDSLAQSRTVLHETKVSGTVGDLLTGFIAIIENGELTLECFSYGGDAVPENYRDLEVQVG